MALLTLVDMGTSLQHLEAAAATSTGTPGWLTALIAGLAAILAAAATALSSAYVAKRKIAEIELTNTFQMAEKYLESARRYTQNVYLPLAVAVHNLHAAFLDFKAVT
jgi:2-methylisocitrate lyase-like PEP mutase family enzyme